MRDHTIFVSIIAALVASSASRVAAQSGQTQPGGRPGTKAVQPAANPAAPKATPRADFEMGDRNPDEPPLNAFLDYSEPQPWTARVQVDITAFEFANQQQLSIHSWNFNTLAVIFPVIRETASASGDPRSVTGELRIADAVYTRDYSIIQGYHSDALYTRWDARDLDGVRDVTLVSETRVKAWETVLKDNAAAVGWPKGDYPFEARSTFEPQFGVDFTERDADTSQTVKRALEVWTDGRDPKSIPPLQLAKYLAGRVVEAAQATRPGLQRGRTGFRRGFEGFRVAGPDATLAGGRGSPFDIACTLAAVYREAGLPARVVVGLREFDDFDTDDVTREQLLGIDALHAYVEFFLYDEATGDQGWIPVDPVLIRRQSSRVRPLEQDWEYFGTHDELDFFVPLAFHLHPPTTVRSYGSPGLWGWYATPATPEIAFQQLTFATFNTPVRAGD